MTSLVLTVTETLRYQGKLGQWSWVLHRVAGLGTLLFVILHVFDTSWATFYPDLYAKAIEAYQTPLYTLGEFALVACVVYHALNGFRISMFDARPQLWRHQADAAKIVLLATVAILVPTFLVMAGHVVTHYQSHPFELGLEKVIESATPFAGGALLVLALAVPVGIVAFFIPGLGGPAKTVNGKKRPLQKSRLDIVMWNYMRISGVLILPLVFGHLAMIHLIQGVFEITASGVVPVGTTLGVNLVPESMLAANFVRLRWDTMFAGVFIWRIYDIVLLLLIVTHGFYGFRYVINDYFHNRILNRVLMVASVSVGVAVFTVGALAIINSVPATVASLQQSATLLDAPSID